MKKSWAKDSFKCRKFTAVVNALNFFLFFIVALRTVTQGTIKYPNKRNISYETDVKPEERLKKNLLSIVVRGNLGSFRRVEEILFYWVAEVSKTDFIVKSFAKESSPWNKNCTKSSYWAKMVATQF